MRQDDAIGVLTRSDIPLTASQVAAIHYGEKPTRDQRDGARKALRTASRWGYVVRNDDDTWSVTR